MLIFTVRFAQLAAVVCRMDDSSSVSKSGSKSLSHLRSLAYASWLKNWALGRGLCIYTYLGGTPSISDRWATSLSTGGTSGVLGGCGISSGIGCLSRSGGGAPVPLRPQCVGRFCAMPFWQGRQWSVGFSQSIAGCLSIAALTFLWPGNSTPRFISSRTSARGFLIRNCVSSIAARKNPPVAILVIFKARCMSDCSSCTQPTCLATVADMLKTYKEICCCMYILDSTINSTIYASVASSNVVKACLVHSRRFISRNLSAKIRNLTIAGSSISRPGWTNPLVDHGGFPLCGVINWSSSSLRTPGECYIINWQLCTYIWQHLHPIACCFFFLPLPVLQTIFNHASMVMVLVAAFAASRWTKWCLRCSWVSAGGVLEEAPIILLEWVPPWPCWGVCGAMIGWWGSEEIMITKRSGKSWGRR